MASLNRVQIIGRLGKDPEKRYTPSGTPVTNFSIATDEHWKDAGGEKKEKVTWHSIVTWNKLAEIAGQYLRKGQQVYIEGKIAMRDWTDRDGNKRVAFEIIADKLIMLGSRPNGERSTSDTSETSEVSGGVSDDDIPF